MFEFYAFSAVMLALSVWCTVCACRDQRRIWRRRYRWQLRNPLTEPSATALVAQRLRFILGAVMCGAIGIVVLIVLLTTGTGECEADDHYGGSNIANDC